MVIEVTPTTLLDYWEPITAILAIGVGVITWYFKVKRFEEDLDTLKDDMHNVQSELKHINKSLHFIQGILSTQKPEMRRFLEETVPGNSPRMISGKGQEILSEKGLAAIADAFKEAVLKDVAASKPQNAYDAQQEVISALWKYIQRSPDDLNKVKTVAFEENTTPEAVAYLMGIHLRDQLFSTLGFGINETDYGPAKPSARLKTGAKKL